MAAVEREFGAGHRNGGPNAVVTTGVTCPSRPFPTSTLDRTGGGGDDGGMDDVIRRVGALEDDMREVKGILTRMEPRLAEIHTYMTATMPHLATKAESENLRSDLKGVIGTLGIAIGERPTKAYLWMVVGVLTATVLAATIGGATLVALFK
jgi:hypothetical protein